jgi:hypothetical protein
MQPIARPYLEILVPSDARLNTGLAGHHKTKKLMRRLGPAGPWGLVCLFLWAAANRTDGNLSGMSSEDIELAADWTGEPDALVTALREVGFLDGLDGGLRIHDWAEHNPWAAGAEDRAESSRWAALCKRYGRAGAAERMPDYADRMRPAREPQCGPHAPLPSPIPDQKQKRSPRSASCPPRPDDVSEQVWLDWLAIRKAKRAPLTVTAFETIQREAIKAGLPLPAAIRVCVEHGWQGFKADWYANLSRPNGVSHEANRKLSPADQVRAHIARADAASPRVVNGHANPVAEDGRDLRPPLDGEFRREP